MKRLACMMERGLHTVGTIIIGTITGLLILALAIYTFNHWGK